MTFGAKDKKEILFEISDKAGRLTPKAYNSLTGAMAALNTEPGFSAKDKKDILLGIAKNSGERTFFIYNSMAGAMAAFGKYLWFSAKDKQEILQEISRYSGSQACDLYNSLDNAIATLTSKSGYNINDKEIVKKYLLETLHKYRCHSGAVFLNAGRIIELLKRNNIDKLCEIKKVINRLHENAKDYTGYVYGKLDKIIEIGNNNNIDVLGTLFGNNPLSINEANLLLSINPARFHDAAITDKISDYEEILINRINLMRGITPDDRPLAIVIFPENDENTAFQSENMRNMVKDFRINGYRVLYFEIEEDIELVNAIHEATGYDKNLGIAKQKASALVIGGHGNQTFTAFGFGDYETCVLDPSDKKQLLAAKLYDCLEEYVEIVLISCLNGKGGVTAENNANLISTVFKRKVHSEKTISTLYNLLFKKIDIEHNDVTNTINIIQGVEWWHKGDNYTSTKGVIPNDVRKPENDVWRQLTG
ncbi:MAG: hypothetical protein ABIH39_07340 [Candidatus Margulisiibacteriota bacterium]